jgi:hypothetical protein
VTALRERLLCELAGIGLRSGGLGVYAGMIGIAIVLLILAFVRRLLSRVPVGEGAASPGPAWAFSGLVAVGLYLLARLVDPLLFGSLVRPADFDADDFRRTSFFEWRLLGQSWARPLHPLVDHPAVALVLHAVLWTTVVVLIRVLVARFVERGESGAIGWDTESRDLPFHHGLVGATTARRADARFRRWAVGLLAALTLGHGIVGYAMSTALVEQLPPISCGASATTEGESAPAPSVARDADALAWPMPSPGAWVVMGIFLVALAAHFTLTGRPSAPKAEPAEKKDEPAAAPEAGEAAFVRVARALAEEGRTLVPSSVTQEEARETAAVPAPEELATLAREVLTLLTGGETLYAHQRAVLVHLAATFRTERARAREAAPSLREEKQEAPFSRGEGTPHGLVTLPEGAGRTTLTMLASLHVLFDRGATSLVVLRTREGARAYADRLRDALGRSSARWSTQIAVAGDDLGRALVAERTPSIVVTDLVALESDVLSDARTDPFFRRLGLVVVDDLDAFVGVPEMHLHMAVRRLWALVDTLHDAPYPALALATMGPANASALEWARHLLAVPLRLFDEDTAPRPARALLSRRDLVDASGLELPIADVLRAAARAGLPWHLRMAGDRERGISRAAIDLGDVRGSVSDPLDASVVVIEGHHPEVLLEAARLAHAGGRATKATRAEVLVVLAPPSDEETVLHEEAADAPNRALVEGLPRFVALSEPEVVRQRHFDRALGREQKVSALRARFGPSFVDESLARLTSAGRIAKRERFDFDVRADDVVGTALVRSVSEAAIGEPIAESCVGESTARVRVTDEGTGELLLELDGAIAPAVVPPEAIVLGERGRYLVHAARTGEPRALRATHGQPTARTAADRVVSIEATAAVDWTSRSLGGVAVPVALVRADVTETLSAIRRYGPGATLLERRAFERPVVAAYTTDVALVRLPERDDVRLDEAAESTLLVSLRAMLPCTLRGAQGLLDVALVDVEQKRTIAFFDRTPGGSGFSRHVHDVALQSVLAIARLALERIVSPGDQRLRALHASDTADAERAWAPREPLRLLDVLLDPPDRGGVRRGPVVAHTAGEGQVGDLGRLVVALLGHADDLAWTRHGFRASFPIGERPPGLVFLDVALERRALSELGSAAAALAVEADVSTLLEAEKRFFAPIASTLADLTGERFPECVVELVAAMPLSPRPLRGAARSPLVSFARRTADARQKCVIAKALLDGRAAASIVETDGAFALRTSLGGKETSLDLTGPVPRIKA